MTEEILTETQAAAILGRSKRTLKRRREAGKIGYINDDGRIYYYRRHIDEYLAAREVVATVGSTPPPPKYRRAGTRSARNQKELLDII